MIVANKKSVKDLRKYIESQDLSVKNSVDKLSKDMEMFRYDIDAKVNQRMDSIEQMLQQVIKN